MKFIKSTLALGLLFSLSLATATYAKDASTDSKLAQEKKDFQASMQKKIDQMKADIKDMKEKTKRSMDRANKKSDAALNDAEQKLGVAQQKVSELNNDSKRAWKDVKSGVENSVDDLQQAFKRAKSQY